MINIVLFIIGFVVVMSLMMNYDSSKYDMSYVQSNINQENYLVRNIEDKQEASDKLARVHEQLKKVVDHMIKKYPEDKRVLRLKKFYSTTLSEADGASTTTSYSINKGDKIVLCIRMKNSSQSLVEDNVVMFVALHELAHIMTTSIGHTDEFWKNFEFLLRNAQKDGYYKCIDFQRTPQDYCGITISSSPVPC